jgi:predicted nucleic acid-binding protein
MADVLVDTDVFVDHLRGARRLVLDAGSSYSMVTRAELFAGRAADEARVRRLLAPLEELAVDRVTAELGGRIRREAGVALPDALIAATAVRYRRALVSRNRRHFERIPGLQLVEPR